MLTKTIALSAREFHEDLGCPLRPTRGARDAGPIRWRVNGAAKTWKTRPDAFRIPVKHGLRDYSYIDERTGGVHTLETCPRESAS